MSVLKDLVKLADHLDRKGLHKESDLIDSLITKMAMGDPMDRDTHGGDKGDDPSEGIKDSDLIEYLDYDVVKNKNYSTAAKLIKDHLGADDSNWMEIYMVIDGQKLLELEGARDTVRADYLYDLQGSRY